MNAELITHHMRRALEFHLHPTEGSAYWLERQSKLNFDILEEIQNLSDLPKLGTMDQRTLRLRPLLEYIPVRFHRSLSQMTIGQTGGTTHQPVWTAYLQDECEEAFVRPFVRAARHVGFPSRGTWLYIGPSGPHIIAQAARYIARSTGNLEPFTVDFDPRWARILEPGSFAAERYLDHVVRQAMEIIKHQNITILFTTPTVLTALAKMMTPMERKRIEGIHYGGQPITRQQIRDFRGNDFCSAVHLSGYGNTLFGCCLELECSAPEMTYHPYGHRLWFTIDDEYSNAPDSHATPRTGRLRVNRFDASMLLLNYIESDEVTITRKTNLPLEGFQATALKNPHRVDSQTQMSSGLY